MIRSIYLTSFIKPVAWSSRQYATAASKLSSSISAFLNKNKIEINESDFEHDLKEPIIDHLRRRGLISVTTHDEIATEAENRVMSLYCGADPTAKSLHLGNLLPLMVLLHFNLRGHTINGLVGGATGRVGDPSGRATERDQMAEDTREENIKNIGNQLKEFFEKGTKYAKSRNILRSEEQFGQQISRDNYDWLKDMGLLDFLSIYGKHIRVNQMLARDSVKSRLESEQGIGFNEFTYQLLQAFDFYYLNKHHSVDIQVGGNDQYGNIVAGIDLISRMSESKNKSYGITVPLLTTAAGVKFGKSAGNAMFIDKSLTSSYNIYQFMYNSADVDVKTFLYKFSLLPTKIIDKVISKHEEDKKSRVAQKLLAMEMCDLIHGDGEGMDNYVISEVMFSNNLDASSITAEEILQSFKKQDMVKQITLEQLKKTNITNLLHLITGGAKSKAEYKRLIKGGSVSVGFSKSKVQEAEELINPSLLKDDILLLIKVGKQYHIVEVIS